MLSLLVLWAVSRHIRITVVGKNWLNARCLDLSWWDGRFVFGLLSGWEIKVNLGVLYLGPKAIATGCKLFARHNPVCASILTCFTFFTISSLHYLQSKLSKCIVRLKPSTPSTKLSKVGHMHVCGDAAILPGWSPKGCASYWKEAPLQ